MSDQARLPCSPPTLHRSEPKGDTRMTSAELDFSRGWRPCGEPFSNTRRGCGAPAAPIPFVLDPLGYSGLTLGTVSLAFLEPKGRWTLVTSGYTALLTSALRT